MNLATAVPEDRFTPAMAALDELMSEISEECYCAGWMDGNEFRLWAAVTDPSDDRQYGQGVIDTNDIAAMRRLSDECGGWIVWGDDAHGLRLEDWGPYWIPLDEWKARYAYETRESAQRHPQEPKP